VARSGRAMTCGESQSFRRLVLYEVLPGRMVLILTYGVERQDEGELRLSDEHRALSLFRVAEIAELALPHGYHRAIYRWASLHNI
jgi:hypothetical protein